MSTYHIRDCLIIWKVGMAVEMYGLQKKKIILILISCEYDCHDYHDGLDYHAWC